MIDPALALLADTLHALGEFCARERYGPNDPWAIRFSDSRDHRLQALSLTATEPGVRLLAALRIGLGLAAIGDTTMTIEATPGEPVVVTPEGTR